MACIVCLLLPASTHNSPAEYQPYVNYLGPGIVQQGDLTDPYYFDFISFAQYLAIDREVSLDPPMVFEERQPRDVGEGLPFEFVPVVVRRDLALTNDRLAPEHGRKVGSAVLSYIDEKLGGTGAGLPRFAHQRRPTPGACLLTTLGSIPFINIVFAGVHP